MILSVHVRVVGNAKNNPSQDLDFYIRRARGLDEILPWGHINNGMKKELLVDQYWKSKNAGEVPRTPYSKITSATA